MEHQQEIINSGVLELYAIGALSREEHSDVEVLLAKFPALKVELDAIEYALEKVAMQRAVEVDPGLKPMVESEIDFMLRIKKGEVPVTSPELSASSKLIEFQSWLDMPALQEPAQYASMAGRIIDSSDDKTTLIIWLKDGAAPETHVDEIEKFLIVEGTCDITIGEEIHSLVAGDFLQIPLHISHDVKVTSASRCKIILERQAA